MMDWKKQIAALPVRKEKSGGLKVLLVTSRETRRYVIPKGWPWPDVKDHKAAAAEALEEAGITGKVHKKAIGSYSYDKRRANGSVPVKVTVYLLEVELELDEWPESHERKRVWLSPPKAAAAVEEPELAELILSLSKMTKLAKPTRG